MLRHYLNHKSDLVLMIKTFSLIRLYMKTNQKLLTFYIP